MTRDEEILEAVIDIVRSELKKFEPLACVGEVTSVNPLNVKVGSYTIDEDFMVIDSSCRKTVINIPIDSDYEHVHDEDEMLGNLTIQHTPTGGCKLTISGDSNLDVVGDPTIGCVVAFRHKHAIHKALPKILVHRGLKVGDKVNVLRVGSIHFIQGRAGISTNDGSLEDNGDEQL